MSVKSSFFYLAGEGYSLHVYCDVTTDKIVMDLDYLDGTYGTNLSFVLGNDRDEPLTRLLRRLEVAVDNLPPDDGPRIVDTVAGSQKALPSD